MRANRLVLLLLVLLFFGFTGSASGARERLTLTEALATALLDSGVQVATNVPATGVSEVFDAFHKKSGKRIIYSYNEEVAYTVAHGAALGGVRAAAILKSHGFAKAANSVIDSITAGTNAGFLVFVFNDKTGHNSDNAFDALAFIKGTKIPFLHPQPGQYYPEIQRAFQMSEELQVPVAVFIESDDLPREVEIERKKAAVPLSEYKRDIYQHLLCPFLAPYQQKLLEARLAKKALTMEKPKLPHIPEQLPPKYRAAAEKYVPVFAAFKKIKGEDAIVAGDTGTSALFAFPPYSSVDITTYYGGSVPLAIGFYMAGRNNVWAVTGDYAFLAAGNMGLIEAIQRGIPLKILIFHNGVAGATGGQPILPGVFENVLGGYRNNTSYILNPQDRGEAEKVLKKAKNSNRLEIIIVEVM